MYWGDQPFTSGPVYAGAIIVFLFALGAIVVKGKMKWWLIAATILSILLSWGHNLMPLTEFFLRYVPGYNKFRAVSMTLVIANLTIPLLAILALKEIFDKNADPKKMFSHVITAFYVIGGILLFFIVFGGSLFNFSSEVDNQLIQAGFPQSVIDAIRADRKAMLTSEATRSLVFIILAIVAIWMGLFKKVRNEFVFAALIVLVTIDMYAVNKRYLNEDDFVDEKKVSIPYTPSEADKMILEDKDPNFRVFNLTVSPFNDVSTSYFHKSIGGYHGAKLRRYQELIDHHISKNNVDVLNMLNTKYFIIEDQNKKAQANINPRALGNAWLIQNIKWAENADEEIEALNDFDPKTTAIIDRRFEKLVSGFQNKDTLIGSIKLMSYKPNELIYNYQSTEDNLVVFSEIYYDKGWNVYVDGKKMPYLRANYVLRAMMVASGNHEIVWKFEPKVFFVGGKISLITSLIVILFFFAALGNELKDIFVPKK